MIDELNKTRSGHIITLEDPIEYIHRNKKCVISQREIKSDTDNYITALRACLRQSPDIILIGEMRDYETIKLAMTAAETGHLVISTLHTVGAVNTHRPHHRRIPRKSTVHRYEYSCPWFLFRHIAAADSNHIREIIPAFEIMHINGAIRNMIRDSKVHQIDNIIYSSAKEGMIIMDACILNLWHNKIITSENALLYCANRDTMEKKLGM